MLFQAASVELLSEILAVTCLMSVCSCCAEMLNAVKCCFTVMSVNQKCFKTGWLWWKITCKLTKILLLDKLSLQCSLIILKASFQNVTYLFMEEIISFVFVLPSFQDFVGGDLKWCITNFAMKVFILFESYCSALYCMTLVFMREVLHIFTFQLYVRQSEISDAPFVILHVSVKQMLSCFSQTPFRKGRRSV